MEIIKEDIPKISNIISESFKVKKIILFGSYAKGTKEGVQYSKRSIQNVFTKAKYRSGINSDTTKC